MDRAYQRQMERGRRAERVRKRVFGTVERPRLCIRRSLSHMYAQIIDDINGKTLLQVASTAKEFTEKLGAGKKVRKLEVSKALGELLAEKAKSQGITKVVFDRKGFLFHGRVKAFADAARSKGLVF